MDRGRAGALLALAACIACTAAAPTLSDQTALDTYEGTTEGCYYNFQHYGEGDRIMTNEPCLNCTCHNRMLMCYLRVCPFTKAIGQDCTLEKRADQCCPIVTCPDVPVDLLTSTSTTSPAEYGGTGVGKVDNYGCTINGKYFPEGSKVPPTPNKPCEHCYCIRNMTTCVMQECTLHVDGCTPIYHKDVCCPVRYFCDHPEDMTPLLLDDMTTTVRPTPGFLLTTTDAPLSETTVKRECVENGQLYPDGSLIKTEKPCVHCYCMKGDIVCVVQECGTPMENEGKNCTSQPPREGQCCPDTYICEGDEVTVEPATDMPFQEVTTLQPTRRVSVEGSGYRNEPDELPYTELPTFMTEEGSGEEEATVKPTDSAQTPLDGNLENKFGSTESNEYVPITTHKPEYADKVTTEPDKGLNTVPSGEVDITEAPVSSQTKIEEENTEPSTSQKTTDEVEPSYETTDKNILRDRTTSSSELEHATTEHVFVEQTTLGDTLKTSAPALIENELPTSPQISETETEASIVQQTTLADEVEVKPQSTLASSEEDETSESSLELPATPQSEATESKSEDDLEPMKTSPRFEAETTQSSVTSEEIAVIQEVQTDNPSIDKTEQPIEPYTSPPIDGSITSITEEQTSASPIDAQTTFKLEEQPTESLIDLQTTFKYDEQPTVSPIDSKTTSKAEQQPTESPVDAQTTSIYDEQPTISPIDIKTTSKYVEQPTVSPFDAQTTSKYEEQTTVSPFDAQTTSKYEEQTTVSPFDSQTTSKYEEQPTVSAIDAHSTSKYEEEPTVSSIDSQTTFKYEEEPTVTPIDSQATSKYEEQPTKSLFETQTTSKFDEQPTMSLVDAHTTSKYDEQSTLSPIDAKTTSKYDEQSTASPTDIETTSKYEESPTASPFDEQVTSKYGEQTTHTSSEHKDEPTTEVSKLEDMGISDNKLTTVSETKEDEGITTESSLKHDDEKADIDIEKQTTSPDDIFKETTTSPEHVTQNKEIMSTSGEAKIQPTTPHILEHDEYVTKEPSIATHTDAPQSTDSIATDESKLTTPDNYYELPETTTANPELNEIGEDASPNLPPGRIPGEGDCLLDGVTFSNESVVPPSSKCHSSCKCMSSIIICDEIICSPQPEYMNDCQPIYDTPDSCCPTYICDHPKETIPPQPHSQMSVTESPITKIECQGNQCEISKDKLPTESGAEKIDKHCTSEECGDVTPPPEGVYTPSAQPQDCNGEGCQHTEGCSGDSCKSIPDTQISGTEPPIKSCDGQSCASQPEAPEVQVSTFACEGEACQKVPEEEKPVVAPPQIPQECTSEECKQTKVPDISVIPCEGDSCSKVESTSAQPECSGNNCEKPNVEEACAGDNCERDQTTEIDKQTVKVESTSEISDKKQDESDGKSPEEKETTTIEPQQQPTVDSETEKIDIVKPEQITESPEYSLESTTESKDSYQEKITETTSESTESELAVTPEQSSKDVTEPQPTSDISEQSIKQTTPSLEHGVESESTQELTSTETSKVPDIVHDDETTESSQLHGTDMDVEIKPTDHIEQEQSERTTEMPGTDDDSEIKYSTILSDLTTKSPALESAEHGTPGVPQDQQPDVSVTTESDLRAAEPLSNETLETQSPKETTTLKSASQEVITESTILPSHDDSQGEFTSSQPLDESEETTKYPLISEKEAETPSSLPEVQESKTTLSSADTSTTELPELNKTPLTELETSQQATEQTPKKTEQPIATGPTSSYDEKLSTLGEKLEQQTEPTMFATEQDILRTQEPDSMTETPVKEEQLDSDVTKPQAATDIPEYSTESSKPGEVQPDSSSVTEGLVETEVPLKSTEAEHDITTEISHLKHTELNELSPEEASTQQPSATEPSESQIIGEKDEFKPMATESSLLPTQAETSTDKLEPLYTETEPQLETQVTEKMPDLEQPQATDKPTDLPKETDKPSSSQTELVTSVPLEEESEKKSTTPAEDYTTAADIQVQDEQTTTSPTTISKDLITENEFTTTHSPVVNVIVDHKEETIKPSFETEAPAVIIKDKESSTDKDTETDEGSGFETTIISEEISKVTEPYESAPDIFTTEASMSDEDHTPHKPEESSSQTPLKTTEADFTVKETDEYAQPTTELAELVTDGILEPATLVPSDQSDKDEIKPSFTTEFDEKEQKPTEPSEEIVTEATIKPEEISKSPEEPVATSGPEFDHTETTPYIVELEEHTHKNEEIQTALPSEEPTTRRSETEQPVSSDQESTVPVLYETTPVSDESADKFSKTGVEPVTDSIKPDATTEKGEIAIPDDKEKPTLEPTSGEEKQTTSPVFEPSPSDTTPQEKEPASTTSRPFVSDESLETAAPDEEISPTKSSTVKVEEEQTTTQSPVLHDKYTKPEEKPIEQATTPAADVQKPAIEESQPTEETPIDEDSAFPPSGGYGQEPDYGDEDQAFGPGTCRYGGKVYVSAQQIPRDDPCDFCFCFRSDIICLQQSCPPPIHGCHEEPIQGFCCPRYECPVSMATSLNVTTTTTTTTTTLPPHFLPHAYKGAALRKGCQIKGHTYKVGEVVRSSSGPCLHCTCGGDGQMKCDPKVCTPEPMLRQMIAAAVSAKRRR